MRSIFAFSLVAASLVLTGCAAEAVQDADEGEVGEADEALTAYGKQLVGAWSKASGEVDLDALVLRADGTFIWHHNIYCIKAPCPTRDEGKFVAYKPAKGKVQGRVRLYGKEFGIRQYTTVIGADGTIKLERYGAAGIFESVGTWCQQVSDCAGQPLSIAVRCAAGYKTVSVCTETNMCGLTCEPEAKPCVVTGCSSQLCADGEMMTTCEYRAEYACYKSAICERNADGACGWRSTPELTACLSSAKL